MTITQEIKKYSYNLILVQHERLFVKQILQHHHGGHLGDQIWWTSSGFFEHEILLSFSPVLMKPAASLAKELSYANTRWTKSSKFASNWLPITWDTLSSESVPTTPPKSLPVKCAWTKICFCSLMEQVPGTTQAQDPKSLKCTINSPRTWLVDSVSSSGDTWPAIIGVSSPKRPLKKVTKVSWCCKITKWEEVRGFQNQQKWSF